MFSHLLNAEDKQFVHPWAFRRIRVNCLLMPFIFIILILNSWMTFHLCGIVILRYIYRFLRAQVSLLVTFSTVEKLLPSCHLAEILQSLYRAKGVLIRSETSPYQDKALFSSWFLTVLFSTGSSMHCIVSLFLASHFLFTLGQISRSVISRVLPSLQHQTRVFVLRLAGLQVER